MPTFYWSLQEKEKDLNLTSPTNVKVRRCCRASAASRARLFLPIFSLSQSHLLCLPGQGTVLQCSSGTLHQGVQADYWQLHQSRVHQHDRGRVGENLLEGEYRGDGSHPPPQHSANSCPVSLRHRQRAPWPWRPTPPLKASLMLRRLSPSSTTIPNSRGSEIDTKATCLFIATLGASSDNTV